MRFEVPQFIEVEDKVFGPFTWRQFVYIAGGAGTAVVLYLLLPFFFFIIFGGGVLALAGFLAFHKVNNRSFSIFLESFLQYVTKKKLYLWKRKQQQSIKVEKAPEISQQTYTPPTQKGSLASLSNKLELDAFEETEN